MSGRCLLSLTPTRTRSSGNKGWCSACGRFVPMTWIVRKGDVLDNHFTGDTERNPALASNGHFGSDVEQDS